MKTALELTRVIATGILFTVLVVALSPLIAVYVVFMNWKESTI